MCIVKMQHDVHGRVYVCGFLTRTLVDKEVVQEVVAHSVK